MALIININRNTQGGAEVYNALIAIRNGLGALQRLDGLRGEAIGDSTTTMQSVFGCGDTTEAQALSDRWVAVLAALDDSGNSEWGKLRDLINPLVASV